MRSVSLFGLILLVSAGCGATRTDCNDGVDNDGDGLIDSLDPGCELNGDLEAPDPTECRDGIDNDGDGLVDDADFGCDSPDDDSEDDPTRACNDLVDNDDDGKVDYPDDPGCDSPVDNDEFNPALCGDGVDNDGDGKADYPFDPGCESEEDDSEEDPSPLPQCADGIDNDGDDLVDYPSDPGCSAASDPDEFNTTTGACGPSVVIADITITKESTGSISMAMPNELTSPDCNGYGGEFAFTYTVLDGPKALVVSTDHPETTLDTVVYVRTECRRGDTELGCDDDGGTGKTSTVIIPQADAGTYFIIVDSFGPGSLGDFKITVEERNPLGSVCDPLDPNACVPGLICREKTPGATPTCEYHVCGDGEDNDMDGKIDYPYDPGCTSILDDDEADPATLPQCGNGVDDDADGLIDFPDDPGCESAADTVELDECVPGVPVIFHPGGTVMGNTSGGTTLLSPPTTCSASTSSSERVYTYVLDRALATLTFSTAGSSFDTVLYIRPGTCSMPGPDALCNDNNGTDTTSRVTVTSPALGAYYAIVDGKFSTAGAFNLSVSGTIPPGDACDPADTAFTCTAGHTCTGGLCALTQCNDGVDNDMDGLTDDFDPGCVDINDNDETDPATPPECADGVDNDSDGLIDYPDDLGCTNAADDSEIDCMDSDPITNVSLLPTSMGTTAGAIHDFTPSCRMTSTAPEVVRELSFPGMLDTLTVDTIGSSYDTVLYMKATDCTSTDVACDDDGGGSLQSLFTLTGVAPGRYFIFVDGYGTSSGNYTLNISGTISAGARCNPDQVAAGVFTCAAGTTCMDDGTGTTKCL